MNDLNTKMLAAFQQCVPPDGWLYALDWRHPSYRFRPHVPFDAADENAWRVPVLPNGDYYIFLADDLRFGVIGHPWEETMCVYEAELLAALEDGLPPLLFDTILRENGRQLRPLVRAEFAFESSRDRARSVVGPPGMSVAAFARQLEINGHDFPSEHATLMKVVTTEEIDAA